MLTSELEVCHQYSLPNYLALNNKECLCGILFVNNHKNDRAPSCHYMEHYHVVMFMQWEETNKGLSSHQMHLLRLSLRNLSFLLFLFFVYSELSSRGLLCLSTSNALQPYHACSYGLLQQCVPLPNIYDINSSKVLVRHILEGSIYLRVMFISEKTVFM